MRRLTSFLLSGSAAAFFRGRRHASSMLGVPFYKGQSQRGTEHGPTFLRRANLFERLQKLGIYLIDEGDIVVDYCISQSQQFNNWPDNQVNNAIEVSFLCQALSSRVSEIARRGNFCLTIGGDHSIACGTVTGQAAMRENLAVVWVDAHPDLNTPQTSPSGNIHGMSASLLLQQPRPVLIPGFEWCHPVISPQKLVYIGLREVDPGEREFIDQLKIKAFTMAQVDRLGIARVMEEALDHVDPRGNSEFHMTFDVDAFDPYYAPSTGTPVDGGITLREGLYVCEAVSQTNRLVSMDLVEINPNIGTVEDVSRTMETAVQIVVPDLLSVQYGGYKVRNNVKWPTCVSTFVSLAAVVDRSGSQRETKEDV